jgi:RimJ/RimL family protein N-acetyltransferase
MLTTPRLLLRTWKETDRAPFAALNADPRVMEFFPKLLTREESDQRADQVRDHFDRHGFGLWAVDVKEVTDFIGFVGLNVPTFTAHFTPCVEIGWRLAYEHWNRGYATEAARAVVAFAFGELQLEEIVAMTAVGNERSRRVMSRLGMTHSSDDDFEHPLVPEGQTVRKHVLYRLRSSTL